MGARSIAITIALAFVATACASTVPKRDEVIHSPQHDATTQTPTPTPTPKSDGPGAQVAAGLVVVMGVAFFTLVAGQGRTP